MKIRRWSIASLIAATLLTPALVACNSVDKAPATPADPKAALLASTKEISKGNFRFTMTDHEATGEGVMHAPSRGAQLSMKMSDASADFEMKMDFIFIDSDTWVKLDFGDMLDGVPGMETLGSGKYLHLDPSKVKDIDDFSVDFDDIDPAGSDLLVKAIVDVQKTGEGTYSGKLDLSKATDAGIVDEAVVEALGAEANALPFEAKLDAQGRLTEFTVKIPAAGETEAHELKITYSDYGAASAPQKPADSEVEEAPEAAYELFK